MSLIATKRVWEEPTVAGSRRMLLLAIADFANDEGIAFPGVRKLAERTCLTERRVQQLLRNLESEGHLAKTQLRGRGKVDCYQLACCAGRMTSAGRTKGAESFTPLGKGEAAFAHSAEKGAGDFTHTDQKGAAGFTNSTEKGEGSFTLTESGEMAFTHSIEKGEEDCTQAKPERMKFSAERVKLLAERAKSSAQKGEMPSHTRDDPSFNLNYNPLIQKSVFSASQIALDEPLEEPAPSSETALVEESVAAGEESNVPPATVAEAAAALVAETNSDTGALPEAHDLFGAVVNVVAKAARGPSEEDTPQQRYFNILTWIVGADYKTISKEMKGQVAQTVGILQKAGYTEDDLKAFWYSIWKKDWRYTKHKANPTLTQVREEIGKLRAGQQAQVLAARSNTGRDASGKPILTPEEQEMQRLMREAKERGRLARKAAQNPGLRVPDLQGHEVGLPHRQSETP